MVGISPGSRAAASRADEMPLLRSTYHRGDLRHALLAVGIELARAGGPSAVVLREATRAVGVSPNAAYRHFRDRTALLSAVCDTGLATLLIDGPLRAIDDTAVTSITERLVRMVDLGL